MPLKELIRGIEKNSYDSLYGQDSGIFRMQTNQILCNLYQILSEKLHLARNLGSVSPYVLLFVHKH